jgi:hypothetical protein
MRRILTLLAAVLALVPAATRAQSTPVVVEQSQSATVVETKKGDMVTEKSTTVAVLAEKKSPITFTPYGFALLNVFFNDSPFASKTYPGDPLPCPASGVADGCNRGGSYVMNVRQSRIGARIAFDDTAGWTAARLSGLFEVDFQGGFTGTTSSTFYNAILRLRKVWGEAAWGSGSRFSIRFGQDDRLVSPLRPASLAFVADPLFQTAGLLHGRAPQLALRYDLTPKDGFGLTIAAAALNPQEPTVAVLATSPGAAVDFGSGNRSRVPNLEGRLGLGIRSGGSKVVDLGLCGGLQQNRFVARTSATGPFEDVDVRTSIMGADLTLNVWIFQVLAEIYQGKGYDIPGALATQGIAFDVTGAGALVLPAVSTAVKATGGWFQVGLNLNPVLLYGGWGGTQTPFSELTGTTLAAAAARVQNFMWAAGAIVSAGKNWKFSLEYANARSWYYSGIVADGAQFSVNSQLLF